MCTAITYQTKDFYFGRNLDYDFSYGEKVTVLPRNFPLPFRHTEIMHSHYAMIGMAHMDGNYPLYYDAVNEKGLAMAGLNFVGNAHYHAPSEQKMNIAHFELIPWLLGQCSTVKEAKKKLLDTNLTNTQFSDRYPIAQLHWIVADKTEAITIESVKEGLVVYQNPIGVLTNNPSFDQQMHNLSNYMHLSPCEPKNEFAQSIHLKPYSRGMGAIGLPGDLSSQSRFVRAAFTKLNSVSAETETSSIHQFFHILDTVSQTRGCCRLDQDKYEITLYASCCNTDKGIYYYTTYDNRQINAVNMYDENLDGSKLIFYPLETKGAIPFQK